MLKEIKMPNNRISEVRTTQKEPDQERRIFTFKATQLVWLLFGILEALIALRMGRTEKTILNKLTLMRKSYGEQLVPRRRMA
jgi:hypothetical protein